MKPSLKNKLRNKYSANEMLLAMTDLNLDQLKDWAFNISSQWNGKNPGRLEDRAHMANDIIKKSEELQELLVEIANS